MDFFAHRERLAKDVQGHIAVPATYTPAETAVTGPARVVLHRARPSLDTAGRVKHGQPLGPATMTRITIFASDGITGAAGDLVQINSTGEQFRLDTVLTRDEFRTIWTVKTVVNRR